MDLQLFIYTLLPPRRSALHPNHDANTIVQIPGGTAPRGTKSPLDERGTSDAFGAGEGPRRTAWGASFWQKLESTRTVQGKKGGEQNEFRSQTAMRVR